MQPRKYIHDCVHCVYIGRVNNMDAYYCTNETSTSYILRMSDDVEDYTSKSDYHNKVYTENRLSTAYADSRIKEDIELDLRRRTLIELLAFTIASSMGE